MRTSRLALVLVALGWLLMCATPPVVGQDAGYRYVDKWGVWGTGNGYFKGPMGITTDDDRFVYVTDMGNQRVQKFNSDGDYILQWDGEGTDGQLMMPMGIAVGAGDDIYVVDFLRHYVRVFDRDDGSYYGSWGGPGASPGQFLYPRGIACAPGLTHLHLWVTDYGHNRVHRLESGAGWSMWGGDGGGDGQFAGPTDIACSPTGAYVYVVDRENHRVQRFQEDGTYVDQWGSGPGDGPGQFNLPEGVAVGPDGGVFVADTGNHRIQKFTATGDFICEWGSYGEYWEYYKFDTPIGIAVDADRYVYVCDYGNDRIKKYRANNRPTVPTQCHLVPPVPRTTNGLSATGSGSTDPDGDTVQYKYQWRKKDHAGASWGAWGYDGRNLDHSNTAKEELWQARVRAYDGHAYSDGWCPSDTLTIRNAPPTLGSVVITPDPAPYWADLECTATGTDDDGDPVTYRYQWYRSSVEQEGRTWRRLNAEYTSPGEQWRCRAWANDGEEDGSSMSSDQVRIMGSPELSWLGTAGYLEDGVCPYRDAHLAWFTFKVRYTGGAPTHVRLHLFRYGVAVAGSPYDMNAGAGDPATGQTFWFKRRLCKGTYSYFFRANDGHDPASGEPSQEQDGPVAHNRAPRLEWLGPWPGGPTGWEHDGVDPQGRQMPGTSFRFVIKYVDREHDPAEYVRLHIARREGATDHEVDGSPFPMEGPDEWLDGVAYGRECVLTEEARYVYWFEAKEVAPAPFTSHDAYGVPTWWRRNMIWVFNAPPQLRWAPGEDYRGDSPSDGLHPNTGSPGDSFTYRVQYRDQEGTEPSYVRLHLLKLIGGAYVELSSSPYAMSTTDTDFTTANYSVTITRPSPGQFRYYFSASDGDKAAIGEPSWHRMPGPTVNGTAAASVKIASVGCQQKGAGTQVTFTLSSEATVTAEVLNIAGRPVRALVADKVMTAGANTVVWDGRNATGALAPSGLYVVRVQARHEAGQMSQVLGTVRIAR